MIFFIYDMLIFIVHIIIKGKGLGLKNLDLVNMFFNLYHVYQLEHLTSYLALDMSLLLQYCFTLRLTNVHTWHLQDLLI